MAWLAMHVKSRQVCSQIIHFRNSLYRYKCYCQNTDRNPQVNFTDMLHSLWIVEIVSEPLN